mmetsp:Transcript_9150/g.17120  ORF Transcript_9150/g.17120 Transcript_9150/m.17120 type:complete len:845 (+) Transcript_9150:272-2806(+)
MHEEAVLQGEQAVGPGRAGGGRRPHEAVLSDLHPAEADGRLRPGRGAVLLHAEGHHGHDVPGRRHQHVQLRLLQRRGVQPGEGRRRSLAPVRLGHLRQPELGAVPYLRSRRLSEAGGTARDGNQRQRRVGPVRDSEPVRKTSVQSRDGQLRHPPVRHRGHVRHVPLPEGAGGGLRRGRTDHPGLLRRRPESSPGRDRAGGVEVVLRGQLRRRARDVRHGRTRQRLASSIVGRTEEAAPSPSDGVAARHGHVGPEPRQDRGGDGAAAERPPEPPRQDRAGRSRALRPIGDTEREGPGPRPAGVSLHEHLRHLRDGGGAAPGPHRPERRIRRHQAERRLLGPTSPPVPRHQGPSSHGGGRTVHGPMGRSQRQVRFPSQDSGDHERRDALRGGPDGVHSGPVPESVHGVRSVRDRGVQRHLSRVREVPDQHGVAQGRGREAGLPLRQDRAVPMGQHRHRHDDHCALHLDTHGGNRAPPHGRRHHLLRGDYHDQRHTARRSRRTPPAALPGPSGQDAGGDEHLDAGPDLRIGRAVHEHDQDPLPGPVVLLDLPLRAVPLLLRSVHQLLHGSVQSHAHVEAGADARSDDLGHVEEVLLLDRHVRHGRGGIVHVDGIPVRQPLRRGGNESIPRADLESHVAGRQPNYRSGLGNVQLDRTVLQPGPPSLRERRGLPSVAHLAAGGRRVDDGRSGEADEHLRMDERRRLLRRLPDIRVARIFLRQGPVPRHVQAQRRSSGRQLQRRPRGRRLHPRGGHQLPTLPPHSDRHRQRRRGAVPVGGRRQAVLVLRSYQGRRAAPGGHRLHQGREQARVHQDQALASSSASEGVVEVGRGRRSDTGGVSRGGKAKMP